MDYGSDAWTPVQEIVRLNFKALHDVVKAHGEALKSVEKSVANKVNRQEHTAALTEKVSVNELTTTFEELSRVIDNKADARDTSSIVERMAGRSEVQAALADKADVADVQRCLDAKAGLAETQQLFSGVEARLDQAEGRLTEALSTKADKAQLEGLMQAQCTREDVRQIVAEAVDSLRQELRGEIKEALAAKASKESVATALKTKANRQDVEELMAKHADTINSTLAQKANVDAVSTALAAKASRAEMLETVDNKVDACRAAIDAALTQKAASAQLASVQEDMERRVGLLQAEISKVDDAIATACGRLERDLATHAKEVNSALSSKASSVEVQQRVRQSDVETMLASKPDRHELDLAAQAVSTKLAADLSRAAAELRGHVDDRVASARSEVSSLMSRLEGLAKRSEVEDALTTKADTKEVALWLQSKAGLDEVTSQLELRDQESARALGQKASARELESLSERLEQRISAEVGQVRYDLTQATSGLASAEQLQQQLSGMVGRSAVETLGSNLEKKANIDDINRSLTEVNRELAQRPTLAELNRVIGEQSLIMESLCSEHLLGRWIWKSGRVKGEKHAVPWNVQNINTNPENFLWEKDKCAITTVAPGLYEVTFGFFTRKKPTVQLLVNGEPVLSAVNSASYAVHHSSGRLAAVGPHPAGNVTGLTLIDYLALPPKARISCSYQGEEGGEGFLGLRKM